MLTAGAIIFLFDTYKSKLKEVAHVIIGSFGIESLRFFQGSIIA